MYPIRMSGGTGAVDVAVRKKGMNWSRLNLVGRACQGLASQIAMERAGREHIFAKKWVSETGEGIHSTALRCDRAREVRDVVVIDCAYRNRTSYR